MQNYDQGPQKDRANPGVKVLSKLGVMGCRCYSEGFFFFFFEMKSLRSWACVQSNRATQRKTAPLQVEKLSS